MSFILSCRRKPQKVLYLATFITFFYLFSTTFSTKTHANHQRFRIEKFSVVFRPSGRIYKPRKRQTLCLDWTQITGALSGTTEEALPHRDLATQSLLRVHIFWVKQTHITEDYGGMTKKGIHQSFQIRGAIQPVIHTCQTCSTNLCRKTTRRDCNFEHALKKRLSKGCYDTNNFYF